MQYINNFSQKKKRQNQYSYYILQFHFLSLFGFTARIYFMIVSTVNQLVSELDQEFIFLWTMAK